MIRIGSLGRQKPGGERSLNLSIKINSSIVEVTKDHSNEISSNNCLLGGGGGVVASVYDPT